MNQLSFDLKKYVIELRRFFHQNPELSLNEFNTCKKIIGELESMGIPYYTICETGVVATIQGMPGKTIALRADIDALPIEEKNRFSYKSKTSGIMHACGHDAHIAMLLGAIKILNENRQSINGCIKVIFQPAEETGEATKEIIATGILDEVDTIFAIHVMTDLPTGKISIESGPRMAGVDDFTIRIKGSGGHGAMPHLGTDALLVGAKLVVNLQEIVSREINPLDSVVITVGKFTSGTKANILASEAVLSGNLRYFNPELKDYFKDALLRISTHTAQMYNTSVQLNYTKSLSPVINDAYCSKIAENAVKKIAGMQALTTKSKMTTSEDFSRYLEKVPGVLAFLGACDGTPNTSYPLHHECFQIDEKALELGSRLYVQYALEFLSNI
ncbi:M20 family metallopeptidase [Clostridium sediminicola]|uniref:amidohydrolase n=1 Tax=Clostridium sediminicola TaxID=3114879 RepID=UPI0031F1DB74